MESNTNTNTITNTTTKFFQLERTPRLAELKVSYRRSQRGCVNQEGAQKQPYVIRDSKSCEMYLREIWNKDTIDLREEVILLCLNTAHEVFGWINISTGGFISAVVDPRVVFGIALQTASASIILAHNHPSRSVKPSRNDIEITQRLRDGGKLLCITLLDHLIISRESYYSFADSGWTDSE
jgi:DNA repair protein RadC